MIEIFDPRTGELLDTDSVPGLASVAKLHDERLRDLSGRLAELADPDSPQSAKSQWAWRYQGALGAQQLWEELADWVGWIRGRYPIARQLPPCWWRHPELVEELTALWVAWREAYADPKAPMTAPIDWHDRWLPSFLLRIGSGGWNISCGEEHKSRVSGAYDAVAVDDDEEFAMHVIDDAASRNPYGSEAQQMTIDDTDDPNEMSSMQMQAAIDSGNARLLGSLPSSPIAVGDVYWHPAGDESWARIKDEATVAFLQDAQRRLDLADAAVDQDES